MGAQSPMNHSRQYDYGATPSVISPYNFAANEKRALSPINADTGRNFYSPPRTFEKRALSPIKDDPFDYGKSSLNTGSYTQNHKGSMPNLHDFNNPSQYASGLPSYRTPTATLDYGANFTRSNDVLA
mmetsp:Transcript_33291/g.30237  ORF Transcript_33291/g.30237 Transcript_33291/m.30237 type:complete len:127 (+) Transcript_33291:3416-3796(+)